MKAQSGLLKDLTGVTSCYLILLDNFGVLGVYVPTQQSCFCAVTGSIHYQGISLVGAVVKAKCYGFFVCFLMRFSLLDNEVYSFLHLKSFIFISNWSFTQPQESIKSQGLFSFDDEECYFISTG